MTSNRGDTDLSLTLGGPLYQMYLRYRLARPPLDLLRRRIIFFVAITWVPLAVISALEGYAVGGVKIPFFEHMGAQVRFFVALPLLLVAEVMVHKRITGLVRLFNERGLIAPEEKPRFNEAIATALRLRNSTVAEVMLLVLAFTVGSWLWRQHIAIHALTWYAPNGGGAPLAVAGYWYAFVSLPVLRFLLLRWYFRLFIWYRFLWKVSRMPLSLNALHPDRAGGLGFLNSTPFAFIPVLLMLTATLAGEIGDRIWHQGAVLRQFRLEAVIIVSFLVLIGYAPLTFFISGLYRARRDGRREYGNFGARYVGDFSDKWIKSTSPKEPGSELGSSDIQSLADLGHSYEVVSEMRLVPFTLKSLVRLGAFVSLPFLPLAFSVIPFEEIISRMIKLVF